MKIYKATVEGHAPIYFGEDARELLLEQVEALAPDRVFIVTDRTVEALYAEEIRELLPFAIPVEVIVFNEGEENKNLGMLQHIAGDLHRAGITARSLVLNVGGGVVLNLGGLAASLLCHGVRFAHVATTLIAQAQVVASNRQLMNFVGERNVIGLYRSPAFSIADPHFLESEPERQTVAGLVDYARQALALGGASYEAARAALSVPSFQTLPNLAATAEKFLEQSLSAAESDPAELNGGPGEQYGAVTGRALELLSEGRLLPGEARYYGMRIASGIARRIGVMNEDEYRRHDELLGRLKLSAPFPPHIRTDRVVYQLHGNNKTMLGSVDFVLLDAVGKISERTSIDDADIAHAVEKVRADAVL